VQYLFIFIQCDVSGATFIRVVATSTGSSVVASVLKEYGGHGKESWFNSLAQ
jgi:hypothetical protein